MLAIPSSLRMQFEEHLRSKNSEPPRCKQPGICGMRPYPPHPALSLRGRGNMATPQQAAGSPSDSKQLTRNVQKVVQY